jgi:hypothetical protein
VTTAHERTAHERAESTAPATADDRVCDVALDLVGRSAMRVSAAIYGTIVTTAVIAALSEDPAASLLEIDAAALLTVVVFWLAHVYADAVGERAATRDRAQWHRPLTLLIEQRPMVGAAFIPAVPLLVGAVIGIKRDTAITIGLAVGIAELCGWGYVAGSHLDSKHARLAGAVFLALLGVGITLLKLLVH